MTPPTALDNATARELEPFLLWLATRAVRDASVARDLVQATFLSLLEPSSTFDARRGAVRSYLAGVLMRKAADHFRRARREPAASLGDDSPEGVDPTFTHDPSRGMDPIDRRRAIRVVDQALSRLPDTQRLAVLACDVEGLDREEAARVLGISEGNLRVALHRARHELREALEHAGMR